MRLARVEKFAIFTLVLSEFSECLSVVVIVIPMKCECL